MSAHIHAANVMMMLNEMMKNENDYEDFRLIRKREEKDSRVARHPGR